VVLLSRQHLHNVRICSRQLSRHNRYKTLLALNGAGFFRRSWSTGPQGQFLSAWTSNSWGAKGINMNIPCSLDFCTALRRRKQRFAPKPMRSARDLRDQIVREARTAWLQANIAYQRLGVMAQLVAEAKLGFALVQAQLEETSAEFGNTKCALSISWALATLTYQDGANP
jgi:outer membrane protein